MGDVNEMNKGVQILLERMNSNPDEFIPDLLGQYPPKWRDILMAVECRAVRNKEFKDQLPFLNDNEIKALWQKMQSLQGELFTQQVMDTLLRDAEYYDNMRSLPSLLDELDKLSPSELSSLSARAVQATSGRFKK
jgi:hypothetical protein